MHGGLTFMHETRFVKYIPDRIASTIELNEIIERSVNFEIAVNLTVEFYYY